MPEITPDEVVGLLTPLFPSNRLNDTQELVLRGSWQGESYQEIATAFDYDTDYIKGVGSQLWRSLSQILGKPVTKSNLHFVIHSYAHRSQLRESEILSKPLTAHDCSSCEKIRIAETLESEKIRDDPNYYDLAEFIQENNLVFNGIKAILEGQFNHLSELEKKIMYWLTIEGKSVSITQLVEDVFPPVSEPVLLESLESLQRRSLIIEDKCFEFTQNDLIRAYIRGRIIEYFYQDLTWENHKNAPRCFPLFFMLQNYPIFKETASPSVQNYQISTFVKPLIQKLLVRYNSYEEVTEQLNIILIKLREIQSPCGYAFGNMINLFCFLNTYLTGADFSELPLWEADLRSLNLEQMNLKHCDLSKSVLR